MFVTSWGTAGTGNGQFTNTRAIAVGPTGDVFVVDFDNAYQRTRIQRFDGAGNFIGKWGRSAFDVDGWFWEPRGIAVDGDNNVFVSDFFRIQKFICP